MSTTLQVHEIDRPEFTVAVRGYDRAQVDEYVGRALEWLTELQARVDDAEQRARAMAAELHNLRRVRDELAEQSGLPSPRSISAFGERLSSVLQSAVEAAEQLRADGAQEAAERRSQLSEECRRMVERASEEAEQILARSREKEREMDRQLGDLTARRAAAMAELGKLQEQLTSFLSAGGTAPVAPPTSSVPPQAQPPAQPPTPPPAISGRFDAVEELDDTGGDSRYGAHEAHEPHPGTDGGAAGSTGPVADGPPGADDTAAVQAQPGTTRPGPAHGRAATTDDPTRTLIARTVSPSPRRRG